MNSDSIAEQLKKCDKSTKPFSLDGLKKFVKLSMSMMEIHVVLFLNTMEILINGQ